MLKDKNGDVISIWNMVKNHDNWATFRWTSITLQVLPYEMQKTWEWTLSHLEIVRNEKPKTYQQGWKTIQTI